MGIGGDLECGISTVGNLGIAGCGTISVEARLANLNAWWKHDEGTGTTLTDYGDNTYSGTIRGSGFWANNGPNGSPVGTYDGSTNDVNAIGQNRMPTTGWVTVVAAIYNATYAAETTYSILVERGHTRTTLMLYISGGELNWQWYGTNWNGTCTSDFPAVADTWYIITAIRHWGAGEDDAFYNGTTLLTRGADSNDVDELPEAADHYLHIGSGDYGTAGDDDTDLSGPWDGYLGDILLYSRQLSFGEIERNFNSLRSRYNL